MRTDSIRLALHDVLAMAGQMKQPFLSQLSMMIQVALTHVLKLTMIIISMKAHFCE
jgi:hypothetical protein